MYWIYPDWPAPKNIHAATTTRQGGASCQPYDSFNLASHVQDEESAVACNRTFLQQRAGLPDMPVWLIQTHSTRVLNLDTFHSEDDRHYDACYTSKSNTVCAILTADCLPILVCSPQTGEIAAMHAGWRGLCNGIVENTIELFQSEPEAILVWFGPAIGPEKFEVGVEVKSAFEAFSPEACAAFTLIDPHNQKYHADLYALARQRFALLGIAAVYGGEYCTFSQPDLFFSYRRQSTTGRMVSFIWRQE